MVKRLEQSSFWVCVSVLVWLILIGQQSAIAQISNPPAGKVNASTDSTAQIVEKSDTLQVSPYDFISPDSLNREADTVGVDSARLDSISKRTVYTLSPDALDAPVKYSMRDSMRYSIREQKIYLYGDARVEYADIVLTSGYMVIDYDSSIVVAEPILDSAGTLTEYPNFEQGAQKFKAKGMRYNFDTQKGIIYNASTQQGDLYVIGGKTKLVAADDRDPTRADNVVYNSNAIFTTCDLDHPHYGIRSSKQKIIPGKQVIVGPSNVELGGVPTPLWLPFGFFPISTGEKSGLIFPTDYTFTDVDGFGFQGVGWYFPWNDNIHTQLTFDVFLKRTFRANIRNDYSKRYKYSGALDAGWSRNRQEVNAVGEFSQAYVFTWRHAQDSKANPYRSFNSNVNFQTNGYLRTNRADFNAQVTGIIRSNLSYAFKFPEHQSWNLTTGFNHTQNTVTRDVDISLPDAQFSTGAMYPFANLGTKSTAWYKKAQLTYNARLRGSISATDTTVFEKQTWDDALFGASQSIAFNAPVNVLKHFRLSPNISYNEVYYLDEVRRNFIQEDSIITNQEIILGEPVITTDTVTFGTLIETTQSPTGSFTNVARTFNANVSLSTQIYGTARFNAGALKGVRHIITPSLSVGFTPSYDNGIFDYYDDVQVNTAGEIRSFDRFPRQPFSPGSIPREQTFGIGYTIGNRVETKFQGRRDSVSKIVPVLNNLSFSGNYNLAVDSFQWSLISVSGAQASFFKKIVRVNFSGNFDVYALDANRNRTKETLLSRDEGLLRLNQFNYAINVGASVGQFRELLLGEGNKLPENSIFSLIDKFRLSYNFSQTFSSTRLDPWTTNANSINASGGIPITPKWSIRTLTIGYDFINDRISYPSVALGRDLHCWEMDFFYSPAFGNTFNFSIRVKPSSLSFLELPYRRGSFIQ